MEYVAIAGTLVSAYGSYSAGKSQQAMYESQAVWQKIQGESEALAHEKGETGRRMGFRVSRKVGNAVTRNHAKRYFRELFRIHQEELPEQCDLVIVVHPTLPKMNRKRIEEDFIKLCRRISALAIT